MTPSLIFLLGACTASTPPGASGTTATTTPTDAGAIDCDSYEGLATLEEIASTPRENDQLEGLAITIDDTFVAGDATYERLRADLTAARSSYPVLSEFETNYDFYGRFIYVWNLDSATLEAIADGSHAPTACANELYQLVDSYLSIYDTLQLEFRGIYDHARLAQEYAALTGGDTEPLRREVDGDHICVIRDGDSWQYRLEDGFGDCTSGCYGAYYYHLISNASGGPVLMDDWGDVDIGGGTVVPDSDPEPDWMGLDWRCFSSR